MVWIGILENAVKFDVLQSEVVIPLVGRSLHKSDFGVEFLVPLNVEDSWLVGEAAEGDVLLAI